LGDPTNKETNLGPVISVASADRIRKQVVDAGELCLKPLLLPFLTLVPVKAGAKTLIPEDIFANAAGT
jgi:hypothetical protein